MSDDPKVPDAPAQKPPTSESGGHGETRESGTAAVPPERQRAAPTSGGDAPQTETPAPDPNLSIEEIKKVTRDGLAKIQEEIFLRLQAFNDSSALASDEAHRKQHQHALAFLREAESNLKETLAGIERDEERAEKKAQRTSEGRRQLFFGGLAVLSLLVTGGGLWVNKINADVNRANADANREAADWNRERAKAAALWNEGIGLNLKLVGPGKLSIRNESRVEALNVEVQRTRLFYSPTCKMVFFFLGHTWAELERLGPYQSASLELTEPFAVSPAVLSRPHGACFRRPEGNLSPDPADTDDLSALGGPVRTMGGSGILHGGDPPIGERLPLCSAKAPCRVVEFVRATALHGRKFERSRDFDEFFLVSDDGSWVSSWNLGSRISENERGHTTWDFQFDSPAVKEVFVGVAEWLQKQPRSPRAGLPLRVPFMIGIWAATGVAAPAEPNADAGTIDGVASDRGP